MAIPRRSSLTGSRYEQSSADGGVCNDAHVTDHRSPSLLTEIERDLLDGVPVADVLRKLLILGGRAGSVELRDWASQELRGYADKELEDLPDYRKVPAIIQLDGVSGARQFSHQTISPQELPEEARQHITNQVPFYQGVGEVQAMAAGRDDKTVRIALPGERYLAHLIDEASGNPWQHINAIYWSVSTAALEGIVDQIKTRLAELLGELRAATPTDADMPTADNATNAVNVVINGKGNRVHVAHADGTSTASADSGEGAEGPFWTIGKRIGATVVGLATIAATIIGVLQLGAAAP
jgi:hypothetical protein